METLLFFPTSFSFIKHEVFSSRSPNRMVSLFPYSTRTPGRNETHPHPLTLCSSTKDGSPSDKTPNKFSALEGILEFPLAFSTFECSWDFNFHLDERLLRGSGAHGLGKYVRPEEFFGLHLIVKITLLNVKCIVLLVPDGKVNRQVLSIYFLSY